MIPESASNHHHADDLPLDEVGEAALGEHPPLGTFATPPGVGHRRSRQHRRASYKLVAAELGQ